jgi:hypothetical protein
MSGAYNKQYRYHLCKYTGTKNDIPLIQQVLARRLMVKNSRPNPEHRKGFFFTHQEALELRLKATEYKYHP